MACLLPAFPESQTAVCHVKSGLSFLPVDRGARILTLSPLSLPHTHQSQLLPLSGPLVAWELPQRPTRLTLAGPSLWAVISSDTCLPWSVVKQKGSRLLMGGLGNTVGPPPIVPNLGWWHTNSQVPRLLVGNWRLSHGKMSDPMGQHMGKRVVTRAVHR